MDSLSDAPASLNFAKGWKAEACLSLSAPPLEARWHTLAGSPTLMTALTPALKCTVLFRRRAELPQTGRKQRLAALPRQQPLTNLLHLVVLFLLLAREPLRKATYCCLTGLRAYLKHFHLIYPLLSNPLSQNVRKSFYSDSKTTFLELPPPGAPHILLTEHCNPCSKPQ